METKGNKTKTAFLALLCLLASCSPPDLVYRVEPDLQPYANYFFETAAQYGKTFERQNLVLRITPGLVKSKGGLGVTTFHRDGQRTIEFDSAFWASSSESVRQVLALHEFGHGFLGRSHNQGYSIMNIKISPFGWPQCEGSECDHKFLLDELFRNENE